MSAPLQNGDGTVPQGYSTSIAKKEDEKDKKEDQSATEKNPAKEIKNDKVNANENEDESEGEYDEQEVNNIIEMLNKLEKKPRGKSLPKKEESSSSSESEEESVERPPVRRIQQRVATPYQGPVKRPYNPEIQAYMQKSGIRSKTYY